MPRSRGSFLILKCLHRSVDIRATEEKGTEQSGIMFDVDEMVDSADSGQEKTYPRFLKMLSVMCLYDTVVDPAVSLRPS